MRISSIENMTGIIDAHLHFSRHAGMDRAAEAAGHVNTAEELSRVFAACGVAGAVAMGTGGTPGVPETHPLLAFCAGIRAGELTPEQSPSILERTAEVLRQDRCVGLKFYCGYDPFYPHDARFRPFYELAGACGKPVVFHTGDTAWHHAKLKYAHPLEIDEVAVDFPHTQFVIAHCGNPWIADAVEVASKNENVAIDLSGLAVGKFAPDELWTHYLDYWRMIRMWLVYLSDETKVMYGSDWPLVNIPAYLELMRRVVPEPMHEAVFGANARRIFHLA